MKHERILLLLLAAGMFTHIMDFMIVMPLGPLLMQIFDISPRQFSLLVSSYTITAGVFGFLLAFWIDRFDRKKALLFVYTGFSLGTLACAFAPSYGFLLITRSLAGAFGGVLGALVLSIVSDAVPLARRAKGIGTVMASFGVASVFGVPFGLFIASKFSWHAPFLFLGILSLAIVVFIIFIMKPMTGHIAGVHASPVEVLTRIFGRPNARLGLTFTSVLMLGHFTIIPFVAPYMVGNVGFTNDQLAYIYLVGGLCTMFFSPWVGKMADKHGRLRIFTIFGSLVILPIIVITNLIPVPLWLALVITAIFFVFSNGRMVPSTTMETAVIRPENRGSYMSIRSSVQQLTSGLASFIAGLIITEKPSVFGSEVTALANYPYVGMIAVVFSLASLYVARKLAVEHGA
ncbi:MAG TPA: MFS transporter [Cyclobacteriaceae bacterium]|jgi:predicted MFS family arabinose efflux permease